MARGSRSRRRTARRRSSVVRTRPSGTGSSRQRATGSLTLFLDFTAHLSIGGQDAQRSIITREARIDVVVGWPTTAQGWFDLVRKTVEDVGWLWTTLLLSGRPVHDARRGSASGRWLRRSAPVAAVDVDIAVRQIAGPRLGPAAAEAEIDRDRHLPPLHVRDHRRLVVACDHARRRAPSTRRRPRPRAGRGRPARPPCRPPSRSGPSSRPRRRSRS